MRIFYILLGMSLVTLIPRILPLVLLSKMDLPPWLIRWLSYIPSAVLAALLFPALLLPNGTWVSQGTAAPLLAALPCFWVALKTKSLFLTVITGIGAMFILMRIP